jgi:KDO2-lipid IV(A) lauroyltransferase
MIKYLYKFLNKRKLSTLHKIAEIVAVIAYYLVPSRRKVVEKNCETIGLKPNKILVKNIYKNIFKSFFEFFYVENIDKNFVLENIEITGKEELLEFYKDHPSLFILTGHIGAWEFINPALSKHFDQNAAIIGRRIKNKDLDDLVNHVRTSQGNKYIIHKNALKEMLNCINSNIPVAVLLDHSSTPKNAIFVDFFGVKTSFIAGPVTLAVKKNIPFKPFFLIRKGLKYEIIHYPLIYPDSSLPVKKRVYKMARDINEVYEDIISKYPEQWFMLHKRFKRTENENGEIENSFYR